MRNNEHLLENLENIGFKLDDLLDLFSLAIEKDPNNSLAYYYRGVAYDIKNYCEESVADFTKAVEIDQNFALAYYNRGLVHDEWGYRDNAIVDYTKVIEIDPNFAKAYFYRGVAHSFNLKDGYDKAIADLTKAIELERDFADAYSIRGSFYFGHGEYKKALFDYFNVLDIDPNDETTYSALKHCYAQVGRDLRYKAANGKTKTDTD